MRLVIVSALCAFAQRSTDIQELSIVISTAASSFAAGAEIDVNLDVTNHSDHTILIPTALRTPEHGGFLFSVTPSGSPLSSQVKMTPYLWEALGTRNVPKESIKDPDEATTWVGGMGAGTRIKAGGTARVSALLNDLYDMTNPGVYTIRVRKIASGVDPTAGIDPTQVVESNTITITVNDPPPPTISIDLSTAAQKFSAGSEINADLAVTNISNDAISLPFDPKHPSAEENGFKLTGFVGAVSPNHAVRSKGLYWWKGFSYQYQLYKTLQSGQTIHYSVPLSTILDIGAAGRYTLEARGIDPVTHLSVMSNPLTIVIQ
jgi:hypothetical protein